MAKLVNSLNEPGVIVVEHSDERLAAVEEAKRTGQELQSVGAKGVDIVNVGAVVEATQEVSNSDSSDPNVSLPDYLVELREGVEDEQELNNKKAQEHAEYSKNLARGQEEAAVSDREKLRHDPYYFANRIAEQNKVLAQAHAEKSAEYMKQTGEANNIFREEVQRLTNEQAYSTDPVTEIGKNAKVTDISESAVRDELKTKDRIIYGEESFKSQAVAPREVAPENERGLEGELTAEPKRLEEPLREEPKAQSRKTKKADSEKE